MGYYTDYTITVDNNTQELESEMKKFGFLDNYDEGLWGGDAKWYDWSDDMIKRSSIKKSLTKYSNRTKTNNSSERLVLSSRESGSRITNIVFSFRHNKFSLTPYDTNYNVNR